MQLLYVWIEDYKNIKEQGFNLGGNPYFFEYKSKENELIITDSDNYIPNFFDKKNKNVSNISAIIGENGSGKTTFLKSLMINNNKYVVVINY